MCWRPRSVLVMPSYYESLSMVALEAWALGKPVLANARCDVLLGQCLRSNAGLYYENAAEFAAALDRCSTIRTWRRRWARTGAAISRSTTAGRSSSGSIWTCSSAGRRPAGTRHGAAARLARTPAARQALRRRT